MPCWSRRRSARGDLARAGRLGRQSLIWSVIFSIPLALGGLALSGPMIGMFGLEPEVAQVGTEYLQVTMGTVVVLVGAVYRRRRAARRGRLAHAHAGDGVRECGQCRAGLRDDLWPLRPAGAWCGRQRLGDISSRAGWRWRCWSARCGAVATA